MKKTAFIIGTTLATLLCATPLATNATSFKTDEDANYTKYYDLNQDGEFTISDAVLAKEMVDEDVLSKQDFLNVCNLVIGNDIDMELNGFSIDDVHAANDSNNLIQSITSQYCVDYSFDGIEVAYRYLHDGVITELRCSDIGISETTVATACFNNVMCVIGISPKNTYTIDAVRSFDLPHEFAKYEAFNLTDVAPRFANYLLYTSGRYENFLATPDGSMVEVWFDNGVTITELQIYGNNSSPIEKELRSFEYEGETLTIGVTAEGNIAYTIE